ncbi:hypothetical protein K501DRAFT_271386 [Backusella circina FSU 941]|nr:hypothetical protein K501DRAFT_271386 [Backusella circina FSU 941]
MRLLLELSQAGLTGEFNLNDLFKTMYGSSSIAKWFKARLSALSELLKQEVHLLVFSVTGLLLRSLLIIVSLDKHKPLWDKEPDIILAEAQSCAGPGCLSPTGLNFDTFGRLYISSDETNEIFIILCIYDQAVTVRMTELVEPVKENQASLNSAESESAYSKISNEELPISY